ncbi:MAG: metallophosphoesterase [Rhodoferax sp.]|uniref:metallophosphoesterase n=1 Tax=Rhodoferax sp. TaxID=50421 RepID=UPI00261A7518|nr:metallophosphoesterase [Rhodoferax sp.]MDD5336372.1 metallophosphoesterase [Rhodoferax sp.]
MKIQLLSDLHLEVHPHWVATPAPGADLLLLAGDVGSYQAGSLLPDDDFGLTRFSPHQGWPTPVLFVPGNHEYDTLDFDAAHARLRETCGRLGIGWLEREVVTYRSRHGRPVRFVGTTLWSDFDALGPLATTADTLSAGLLAQQLRARDKAFRAANYYLKKTGTTRQGVPMLAESAREQALLCQDWLTKALLEPFDGITVVLTHFAPSLLSADPRYGVAPGTAGFCSALDHLLPLAQFWLHGHLHAPSDYVKNGCRVVANPLGYARKNEQTAFDATFCIQLRDRNDVGYTGVLTEELK